MIIYKGFSFSVLTCDKNHIVDGDPAEGTDDRPRQGCGLHPLCLASGEELGGGQEPGEGVVGGATRHQVHLQGTCTGRSLS